MSKIYNTTKIGGSPPGGGTIPAQPMSGSLIVNGATFELDSQFPTTGFIGATFQILLNGDVVNNSSYSWSSDQPWVSVDAAGNVSFTDAATSDTKTVTITATGSSAVYVWSFTVSYWFTNNGSTSMTWADANDFASTRGGLSPASGLTNDALSGVEPSRAVGSLWTEWGAMDSYPSGFRNSSYWTSESSGGGNYYVVNLMSGVLGNTTGLGFCYIACRQGI